MLFWSQCSEQTATSEQKTDGKESESKRTHTEQYKWRCPSCSQGFTLETPRLQSRTACATPETAEATRLSPNPEVVCQKTPETPVNHHKLDNIHNNFASRTNQTTQEIENKQLIDVLRRTLPPKGLQLQIAGIATEKFREDPGNGLVPFFDSSNSCPVDIQESDKHIMTTLHGEKTFNLSQ